MKTMSINSSVISNASYEGQTLTLDFTNGKSTSYIGVPESVALGLESAASAGAYYNDNIKGKYQHS